jgi:hypothetical protein
MLTLMSEQFASTFSKILSSTRQLILGGQGQIGFAALGHRKAGQLVLTLTAAAG